MSRFIMRTNCHPFFSVLFFESNGRGVSMKIYKRTKAAKLHRKLYKRKLVGVFEGIERKQPIFYDPKKMGTYKRAVARFSR